MKQIKMAAILMALVLGGFTSCTKENNGTDAVEASNTFTKNTATISNIQSENNIASFLENATWKVSAYSGNVENTDFSSYLFNFNPGGDLSAIYRRSAVYDGSWIAEDSKSTITINFGEVPATLTAMEGTWMITEINESTARLQRMDGSGSIVLEKTQNTF